MDIRCIGRGVLCTGSPPSLEQTMGGLDHTQARQRVPRTAAGGDCSPQVHTSLSISTCVQFSTEMVRIP